MNREFVKLITKVSLDETETIMSATGLKGDCFESDALIGDSSTIVLISLLGVEIVRAIQSFISEFVKREKSIEIHIGENWVKVSSSADIEKATKLLNNLALMDTPDYNTSQDKE